MRVLWLVNIIMPDFAQSLGLKAVNAGGWLTGQLNCLKAENAEITVCTVSDKISVISRAIINGIEYIAYPPSDRLEQEFKSLITEIKPDTIHIFGTENRQSLLMAQAADYKRCLITVQGLISECKRYYFNGLPKGLYRKKPIKLFCERLLRLVKIRPDIISSAYQNFCKNAEYELSLLKNAQYITGRTHWDKAAVKAINPDAEYFHLNENLRDTFYESEEWKYEACSPHTAFVSQANYPLKGFHMLLTAAAEVKQLYPDFHIYVGGQKPVASNNYFIALGVNYFFEYQAYVKKLIKKYGLEKNITFLGALNAQQMKEQYLKANVFISPSAIENSPNSVGEAMILGTPVISSDVGGVSSLLTNEAEGLLYDFYDTNKLAECIIQIFDDKDYAAQISDNSKARAAQTHNKHNNTQVLMQIYSKISN